MTKKQLKDKLESTGESVGDRLGQGMLKNGDKKAAQIGMKVGRAVGEQVEWLRDAIDKETVTKEEELGIGGKIGTGLGIIGKRLVDKGSGLMGRLVGTGDPVSEGRIMGAKTEKILKKAVKSGVERIRGSAGNQDKGR